MKSFQLCLIQWTIFIRNIVGHRAAASSDTFEDTLDGFVQARHREYEIGHADEP